MKGWCGVVVWWWWMVGGCVVQCHAADNFVERQWICNATPAWAVCCSIVCVVMWGGRSFGLHTSKVRAKDRGHTYSLHRTYMGCLMWTVRAHVL
jgi:hypothetical protein